MEPLVSVVIPTLARPSLIRAVNSALAQDVAVEVIVVDDRGGEELRGLDPRARVLRTAGRVGAAEARNIGMAAARGAFIAFLDDDDVWLDGHLSDAMAVLADRPDCDIYAARGLVLDETGGGRVEPAVLVGSRTVADYFFERRAWWSRCRRILTPTLVFRSHLADHRMDPVRRVNEDTWWLLTAERDRGARLVQSAHIGVLVNGSAERTAHRRHDDLDRWLDDVEGLHRGGAATELLTMTGRSAVRAGRPGHVRDLARDVLSRPGGVSWAPVLAAHMGAAALVGANRKVRGRLSGRASTP